MQFSFRIDDNNYATFALTLSPAIPGQPDARPEVNSATLSDSKLSHLSNDDILSIASDVLGLLDSAQPVSPQADWYDDYRSKCI